MRIMGAIAGLDCCQYEEMDAIPPHLASRDTFVIGGSQYRDQLAVCHM
jgi:hypothetical protein